jgi:hypothetical protein
MALTCAKKTLANHRWQPERPPRPAGYAGDVGPAQSVALVDVPAPPNALDVHRDRCVPNLFGEGVVEVLVHDLDTLPAAVGTFLTLPRLLTGSDCLFTAIPTKTVSLVSVE